MESSSGHRIVRYAPIVSTFHSKRNHLDLYPQGVHRINFDRTHLDAHCRVITESGVPLGGRLRGGFHDVGRGLYAAMTAAFYVFLKYAKVYERQLKNLHP